MLDAGFLPVMLTAPWLATGAGAGSLAAAALAATPVLVGTIVFTVGVSMTLPFSMDLLPVVGSERLLDTYTGFFYLVPALLTAMASWLVGGLLELTDPSAALVTRRRAARRRRGRGKRNRDHATTWAAHLPLIRLLSRRVSSIRIRGDPEMGQATEMGRRNGAVGPELQSIVEGVDFVPERLPRTDTSAARGLLERDGAVILSGWPEEADSVVNAAAAVLGTRLRELEKASTPRDPMGRPREADRGLRGRDHDRGGASPG